MVIALVLSIIGLASILLEFFIPAFGLIGIIGAGSIVAGIVLAFRISTNIGSIFLIASLIIIPVLMMIFFRLFPKTFIGKKLILHRIFETDEGYKSIAEDYSVLENKTGTASTDLRPSGMIIIDDKKYSAVTSGEYIEKTKRVTVIKTEGSKITVSEVKEC